MVTVGNIVAMTSMGLASIIGGKVLSAFGKQDLANFVDIAGLGGIAISAIAIIIQLLSSLTSLG